ncbi:DNA topoisomerase 1 [Mortierella sp. AD031]|nr:DNA topoisomerase 1 [Mortierella sp. AD031]
MYLEKEQDNGFGTSNERKAGQVTPARGVTVEKCATQLLKLDEQISAICITLANKDYKNMELGTSKAYYIVPRISAIWCKKHEAPLEKLFTKALRDKFE